MIDPEVHIMSELTRLGIPFERKQRDIAIPCPIHHSRGFKLWIHKTGKMARCWSPRCDWRGNWNKLAGAIGARPFDEEDIDEFALINREAQEQEEAEEFEHELPIGLIKWKHGNWRGIDEKWLHDFPAYRWFDPQSGGFRILFPIEMHQELMGWVAARIDPKDQKINPKYRNSPNIQSKRVLFPFDKIQSNVAIMVEGPFDSLWLQAHGLPAVALLGAGLWSDISISDLISQGVEKLIILPDGDEDGRKMKAAIERDAEETFELYSITLDEGVDPGDLDMKYLEWLQQQVDKLSG
jgi:Toprim-like